MLKITLLCILLACSTAYAAQDAEERKYFSSAADFTTKSAATVTGKYYSIREKDGQPASLQVLDIKSFTKDRVVYDLVEYKFNPKPSDLETMNMLGAVSVSDPNPSLTIQRRQARLPKPYGLTGEMGIEKRNVEAPLKVTKPNEKAVSCYRYVTTDQSPLVFEFCEDGYRGINFGFGEFRRQGDYEPKSIVAEVLAANPGFPEKIPDSNGRGIPPRKPEPQDAISDIRHDGEIIASAVVCLDSMGLLPHEEGTKIGAAYTQWLRIKYAGNYMEQHFYIFKESLTAGDQAQQRRGMEGCDERIAAFDELARIIGYQRPRISPRK